MRAVFIVDDMNTGIKVVLKNIISISIDLPRLPRGLWRLHLDFISLSQRAINRNICIDTS